MAEWKKIPPELEKMTHRLRVEFPVLYGRVHEYGCEPHAIGKRGIAALARWAKIKVRIYSYDLKYFRKTGKERIKKRKLTDEEAWDMAYAVANKIKKYGQRPKPWFRPAVDEARMYAAKLMVRGIKKGIGTKEIADFVVARAQNNIKVQGMNYTGKMAQTFKITDLTTGEVIVDEGGEVHD